MIHVDYSGNHKQQNEIKAAYYGQGKTVCKSYALATEENDHSCNVSFALNHIIICQISSEYCVSTNNFWSNGCASQFRSQYAFYMLSKFDPILNLEWHFFEANHGKGGIE